MNPRLVAFVVGFVVFPVCMASPAWWPLAFGGSSADVEQARVNAYAHGLVLPTVLAYGALLVWLLRRWFFQRLVAAIAIGVAVGLLSGGTTYVLYTKPIVHAWPLYKTVPYLACLCAIVTFAVAAKIERRKFGTRTRDGAA